jgi:hypothetical protein
MTRNVAAFRASRLTARMFGVCVCGMCIPQGSALGGEAWSVIVESNFKIYAYTNSEHIVLLLNLFVRVEYLL